MRRLPSGDTEVEEAEHAAARFGNDALDVFDGT